jgi:uncharacterized protein
MVLPLHIFEPRYRLLMARRMDADPAFGVILTRLGREVGDQPETYPVGTAATLMRVVRYEDGRYDVTVRGGRRFRVLDGHWNEGYLTASVEWIDPPVTRGERTAVPRLLGQVKGAFNDYLDALERSASLDVDRIDLGDDPDVAGYAIGLAMPFDVAQRQRLLEAVSTEERLEELLRALRRERELLVATGIIGAAIQHPGARFSTN